MLSPRVRPSSEGQRIVICDYNALLMSVTGLLRMSGYCVFQAHDGRAVQELCAMLPRIELLVLNTHGSGIEVGELIRLVRAAHPALPVLHIGASVPLGLPADIPTLPETFGAEDLLATVRALLQQAAEAATAGVVDGSRRSAERLLSERARSNSA
jgi:DNA-binding response OmpR family regulator